MTNEPLEDAQECQTRVLETQQDRKTVESPRQPEPNGRRDLFRLVRVMPWCRVETGKKFGPNVVLHDDMRRSGGILVVSGLT